VNEDNECADCAAGCGSCSLSANNCTSCLDGFELDEETNSCSQVGGGGPGDCGVGCLDCANDTYCNECDSGFYLSVSNDLSEAQCVEECPDGSSPAQDSNECVTCNLNYCKTCFVNSTCSACDSGYALQNGICTKNCS